MKENKELISKLSQPDPLWDSIKFHQSFSCIIFCYWINHYQSFTRVLLTLIPWLLFIFVCRLTSIPVVASIQPQQPQCKACPIHILIIIVLSIKVQLRQQPWTLIQHPQVYLPHRFVFHSFFVNCQKINLIKIIRYPWHM